MNNFRRNGPLLIAQCPEMRTECGGQLTERLALLVYDGNQEEGVKLVHRGFSAVPLIKCGVRIAKARQRETGIPILKSLGNVQECRRGFNTQ